MKLRSLLLAGAVFPLAMNAPVFALDQAPRTSLLQLAQNEVVCPEGEECPPPEGQTEEQPPAEEPPAEVIPEEPPAEVIPEEPPAEVIPEEPPAEVVPEEPPAEVIPEEPPAEVIPEEPPAEVIPEEPPADLVPVEPPAEVVPEEPPAEVIPEEPPADVVPEEPPAEAAPQVDPALEPTEPAPDLAPTDQGQAPELQPDASNPPEPTQPGDAAAPLTPPPESVTEQQLEAQGDNEEAKRVRTLRDRLLDQLEQVLVPEAGEPEPQRDRRDRRRGRGRDGGYDRWYDDRDVVEDTGDTVIIIDDTGRPRIVDRVPDDAGRLLYGADNIEVEQLRGGRTRTTVYRSNGVRIVTVRDRYGEIISRVRVLPNGREVVLIDNRFPEDYDRRRPRRIDVPPPVIGIPEDRYIVDLGEASYDDIRGALTAPPVQQIERRYTLDEVLQNETVRAYSPRVDLDTITFEFGSSTIGNDQMRSLRDLGRAMEDVLAENPDEVYLIEGHTDLVGTNNANLILSDRRAEAVAVALSQNFDIPPENLITQGYGEEYPKVLTDGPERQNRRATVRRVTELLQAQNQ